MTVSRLVSNITQMKRRLIAAITKIIIIIIIIIIILADLYELDLNGEKGQQLRLS